MFLVIAGTIGVISPSGNEIGQFLWIEQAALAHVVPAAKRTNAFAWYTLTGSFATAIGSLCGGILPSLVHSKDPAPTEGYRAVVFCYAALGAVLTLVFAQLSAATEVGKSEERLSGHTLKGDLFGVGHSREIVLKLSGLFALDSFGGGFVVQSLAAYWFYLRFGIKPAALGAIFFAANLQKLAHSIPGLAEPQGIAYVLRSPLPIVFVARIVEAAHAPSPSPACCR